MLKLKAPWNKRNGRFSWLKGVVFGGQSVLAAWIIFLAATGALDSNGLSEMIHRTGQRAIRFVILSLLMSSRRRPVGAEELRQNVMFVRSPITSSFLIFCIGSFGLAIPAPGLMKYWKSG